MAYYILKSYKSDTSVLAAFEVLSRQKNCFLLDSSIRLRGLGRYSFLGIDPFSVFISKNKDPFDLLRKKIEPYQFSLPGCDIPFLGGAVGYLSYDLGFILENKVGKIKKDDLDIPDCFFYLYNTVVIFDHAQGVLYILALGFPEKKSGLARKLAEANFKKILKLISLAKDSGICEEKKNIEKLRDLSSNFTKAEYINAVKIAKGYIKQGDIYQVNLSQQFTAKSSLTPACVYRRLRQTSPAAFSAYFDTGDFQIISSSPERFLRLDRDLVSTRPMKGTRPRSRIRLEDEGLKKSLINSPKDKAELLMIVDLERNDFGRVCDYDSIKVPLLRQVEEYSTVFQTTATVEGKLAVNKDRFDLLKACFPGGSVTGCPKIRAMQIIEELEPHRRGIYTGSLGYLSFSGDMDFNILIRSILKKNEVLSFGVGGGIVADSSPSDEYQETLVKAQGIFQAIGATIASPILFLKKRERVRGRK